MTKQLKQLRKKLKLQMLFAKRSLVKPSFPKNPDGKVLVHIGCGKINSPEFINIDAQPFPHIHIVTDDITSLPDLESETVDLVYMCHIVEHFKKPEIEKVFKEMKRVLKKGGIFRISVPDFDKLIEVYHVADRNIEQITKQLMGGQDHQYNIHYSVFNHEYLESLLKDAGFSKVIQWDPENCQYHDFKDRAARKLTVGDKQYAISLNLEAIK